MNHPSSIDAAAQRTRRTLPALACALAALFALQSVAHAQSRQMSLDQALALPRVETALQSIDRDRSLAVDNLIRIGSIVSPSGQEQKRAAEVSREMRAIGLKDVQIDAISNVTGTIPGSGHGSIVFISTLDDLKTVAEFQQAAKQPLHAQGDRVTGPGSNTSTTTVSLLAAAKAYLDAGLKPERTLVFAAVAQEETGLAGMRALYKGDLHRATAFVDVLGDGHSILFGAITIHWWKVMAHGPGGHTLMGGLPNVNQGIGRAVDRVLQLPYDKHYAGKNNVVNVAILQSGTVFNHKPDSGWFSLDVRSSDGGAVDAMEGDIRGILKSVSAQTGISFDMEVVDQTPGGQIPGMEQGDLVQTSAQIARHLGLTPKLSALGSSNMNIPIGGGTPAIGLGGERGGARGEPGEWADVPQMLRTAKHVLLLAVTMGGVQARASDSVRK
ncbi:MAG: M20/M25/M40 family metallo-hydrolase [Rhodanobacter sp.]